MNCPACRSAVDHTAKYCPNCGTGLQAPVCASCGAKHRYDDLFCANCGQVLPSGPLAMTFGQRPTNEPESERKFVTILRADLVRSTDLIAELGPEDAVLRLEPALAAMRTAVRAFGGIVSKETGDGLSAVFGAPLANDHHGPLACHAAIDLVRRIAALNDPALQVRVGLHSGLVVTYMVASEFSRVFELGGPAQHMAVRLEGLAKAGEIWASESCKSLSEGHVAFEHLGFKTLKGFANPIPVYRVVAVHDIVSWRIRKSRMISRFVGRSTEIAQLRRAAAETTDHGQACHLVGDAGIGKSRLVHEFVQELTSAGWVLIRTECSPTLRASPFAALKSLLLAMRGYLRERSRGGPDLWGQLPQLWQAAVDSVLGLAVLHPPWDELTPDLRGRAICEAFQRVVLMVADQQPVILLIEDVHWLDSASSTVIGSLDWPNLPKHLFVLATSRPDETPDWCSNPATEKLLIQPLDAQSGRSMLDDMLGLSVSTAELKNRISEHTGNVPLFIEEVCRRLREIGVVQGEWGRMTATSLPRELDIPPSVQGVIAARIDRLLRDERRLLQIAACIGPTATVATLRGVAAIPETVLQRLLTALDAAELLIEVQTPSAPSYRFPHELVRQVTYDSMLERARTRLHGRILSTLESLAGPDAREDVLCHHASRAKDWPKAFRYGRTVARTCVATSAFANAAYYFDVAIDALDNVPNSIERELDAVDLRIEARMAFSGFGQVDRWIQLATEAEHRARAIGDAKRSLIAMAVRAAALNFYGAPAEAIAVGQEVVRQAESLGDPGWLNFAYYGLGQAYFIAGRCREAERLLARPYRQLTGAAPSAPVGITVRGQLLVCCMMKTVAHTMLGEFDIAASFDRKAQEIASESKRAFDRVAADYSSGVLLLGRGALADAAALLTETIAFAEKHEVRLFLPVVSCVLGMTYLEQGRIAAALDWLTRARDGADAIGHASVRLRASIYIADALARSQEPDLDRVLGLLEAARNTARQEGFEGLEAEALFVTAMAMKRRVPQDLSVILNQVRASVAIASRIEAAPLLAKLAAFQTTVLADAHDARLIPS